MSNSLDSDQARRFVRPGLGPNCFKGYQKTTLVGKELRVYLNFGHSEIFDPIQNIRPRMYARHNITVCAKKLNFDSWNRCKENNLSRDM